MKRKLKILLTIFLAGSMLIASSAQAASFPDVAADADYAEAINYVSEQGIIVGDSAGNFNPEQTVTRAQMAAIICRMLGATENLEKGSDFTDVPANHWANAYINKAVKLGIVGGFKDGTFGPSQAVTYEQAVTMIVRALDGAELAAQSGGYPDGFLSIASQHGFLENIHAQKGDAFSRKDVANLVFNCAYFSFAD